MLVLLVAASAALTKPLPTAAHAHARNESLWQSLADLSHV